MDHITPNAVCPELDNEIADLELMPLRMDEGKTGWVGARQVDMFRKLKKARLLSENGLKVVESAARERRP